VSAGTPRGVAGVAPSGAVAQSGAADDPVALTDAVLVAIRAAGVEAAGVARAERFEGTLRDLHDRRRAGLHGGMAFTYRNPERSTDPSRILDGAESLIVGARSYLRRPGRTAQDKATHDAMVAPGRVARYAWTDPYEPLRRALEAGAAVLRANGWKTRVVADSNALVDREAARRAGIGWYGRNANLLLPGLGSWFVLGTVVTDAPLVAAVPVEPGCGTCTKCLDGCPTGAIVAPGVVDARRCIAWLVQAPGPIPRELRVQVGDRMYGCDDCQEVCPPNRAAQRRSHPTVEAGGRPVVDAVTFLDDDDDAVLAAAGHWYVPQREARYLRRNALVVLGNAGDPSDPRTVAALRRALADRDPLIRAHAVWASGRLGRPELAEAIAATEADPMVVDELRGLGTVPRRV
jgi:epoxyqueuosine reductase